MSNDFDRDNGVIDIEFEEMPEIKKDGILLDLRILLPKIFVPGILALLIIDGIWVNFARNNHIVLFLGSICGLAVFVCGNLYVVVRLIQFLQNLAKLFHK